MALSNTIDERRNLIVLTGEYADAAEWERVLTAIAGDARRRPGCLILRDQRGGTRPVDPATVVGIMDVVRRMWRTLDVRRAAIVMQPASDSPALVAHAIAEAENMPIRAFADADVAIEWLTGEDRL